MEKIIDMSVDNQLYKNIIITSKAKINPKSTFDNAEYFKCDADISNSIINIGCNSKCVIKKNAVLPPKLDFTQIGVLNIDADISHTKLALGEGIYIFNKGTILPNILDLSAVHEFECSSDISNSYICITNSVNNKSKIILGPNCKLSNQVRFHNVKYFYCDSDISNISNIIVSSKTIIINKGASLNNEINLSNIKYFECSADISNCKITFGKYMYKILSNAKLPPFLNLTNAKSFICDQDISNWIDINYQLSNLNNLKSFKNVQHSNKYNTLKYNIKYGTGLYVFNNSILPVDLDLRHVNVFICENIDLSKYKFILAPGGIYIFGSTFTSMSENNIIDFTNIKSFVYHDNDIHLELFEHNESQKYKDTIEDLSPCIYYNCNGISKVDKILNIIKNKSFLNKSTSVLILNKILNIIPYFTKK